MTPFAYILNLVKLLRRGPLVAFALYTFLRHAYYVGVAEVILLFLRVGCPGTTYTGGRPAASTVRQYELLQVKSGRSQMFETL